MRKNEPIRKNYPRLFLALLGACLLEFSTDAWCSKSKMDEIFMKCVLYTKSEDISYFQKEICSRYLKEQRYLTPKTDKQKEFKEDAAKELAAWCLKKGLDDKAADLCVDMGKTTFAQQDANDKMVNSETNKVNFEAAAETIKSIIWFMFPYKKAEKSKEINKTVRGYIEGCNGFFEQDYTAWVNYLAMSVPITVEQEFINFNAEKPEIQPCDLSAGFVVVPGKFTVDVKLRNFFGYERFLANMFLKYKLTEDLEHFDVTLKIDAGELQGLQGNLTIFFVGEYFFKVRMQSFDYSKNEHQGYVNLSTNIELPGPRFELKL